MQIVVESLLTHYERAGKGKTVVLLHGWGDDLSTFRNLQRELGSSYDVISLDLPGFGQTQPPSEVWGLRNFAEFVQAFLDKLGLNPYAFVGHSHGGAVLIVGLGERVLQGDKAVLLAAAGIRAKQSLRRLFFMVVAKSGKLATFFLPVRYKQALRRKLYGAAGSDMLVAPHLEATFKRTVREDIREEAKRVTQPTLLIYGSRDEDTPVSHGQTYTSLMPQAHLKIVKAGHFVHQDQAEKVANLVKEFLR